MRKLGSLRQLTIVNREMRVKGRLRGKQPKLNPRQEAHLVALFDSGDHSTAEFADLFGATRSTVYRAVERSGLAPVWALVR